MGDEVQPQRKEIRYQPDRPDEYVNCPYFPEHQLRRSRMPYHLMKCQNNPKAPKLLACPFNYMHRVKPGDQENHLQTCEDRVVKRYKDKSISYARTEQSIGKPYEEEDTTDEVPPETGETNWW